MNVSVYDRGKLGVDRLKTCLRITVTANILQYGLQVFTSMQIMFMFCFDMNAFTCLSYYCAQLCLVYEFMLINFCLFQFRFPYIHQFSLLYLFRSNISTQILHWILFGLYVYTNHLFIYLEIIYLTDIYNIQALTIELFTFAGTLSVKQKLYKKGKNETQNCQTIFGESIKPQWQKVDR